MPALQACLFDLDGVIVDTARFHYVAWRELANDLGFDLSESQNETLKGISRMESLDIILNIGQVSISAEEKLERAAKKNTRYLELCQQITPEDALPGVLDFLAELKNNQIRIGLGSASKNARLILHQLQITDLFETIIDGTHITKGKPDPEVFILGATELGTAPASTVVFEDAVAGIQAGNAAGMPTVGIGEPMVLHEAKIVIPGFASFRLSDLKKELNLT